MSRLPDHETSILKALRGAEERSTSPVEAPSPNPAAAWTAEKSGPLTENRVTVSRVWAHPDTELYLAAANEHLRFLGFTEHGLRHAEIVSRMAAEVLSQLGLPQRQVELASISGLLHDIGNSINRDQHGQVGALLARDVLLSLGMPTSEILIVMAAIGNHEEERGHAISPVAAALILADKADVHRTRVHNPNPETFDIHDRVNYAATRSSLHVDASNKRVMLDLTIDTSLAAVIDYFEIFMSRMIMCRHAAEFLGCHFQLEINGTVLA
jgi:putative nucleotidyltransferase with HDIG domain